MRYTDDLDLVRDRERELLRLIAIELAAEAGRAIVEPEEDDLQAARAATRLWTEVLEEENDPRAFRPLTPLNRLLAEHTEIAERIADMLDRRLS